MVASAAIVAGGAALGAGAQVYSAHEAASAQTKSAKLALSQLQADKNQAVGYLDPYQQAGSTALSPLSGILTGQQYDPTTGQTTSLTPDQRNNLFYQSPDYQFNLDQTQLALQRSQTANGTLNSGGAQKEIANYASGLASQQYNNYINQLFQLSQGGQSAASNQASVVAGFAPQIANAQIGIGNAQAGFYNALGQIGGGLGSAVSGIGGLNAYNNSQSQNPLSSATGGGGATGQYGSPYSTFDSAAQTQSSSYGLSYNPLTIPE